MTRDAYLIMTCKHNPQRRIEIGKGGKHHITQWRCACGRQVALTELQKLYVIELQLLLTEQEASITASLDNIRNKMSKQEQTQLESIVKAVINSSPPTKARVA